MKIESLNKDPKLFEITGFPEFLEYDSKTFKGHQIGVCIGQQMEDGSLKSFISSEIVTDDGTKDTSKLAAVLKLETVFFVKQKITQMIDGKLIPSTMIYLPYMVSDHPLYTKPTINMEQLTHSYNTVNHVIFEVLLVNEWGQNHYLYFKENCYGDYNFFDFVDSLNSRFKEMAENPEDNTILIDEEDNCWKILLYDEIGNEEYVKCSENLIRNMVSSIRIIDIKTEIVDNKE